MIWRCAIEEHWAFGTPGTGMFGRTMPPALILVNHQINAEVLHTIAQFRVLGLEMQINPMAVRKERTLELVWIEELQRLLSRALLKRSKAGSCYIHRAPQRLLTELESICNFMIEVNAFHHRFVDHVFGIATLIQAMLRRKGEMNIQITFIVIAANYSVFYPPFGRTRVKVRLTRSSDGEVCLATADRQHAKAELFGPLPCDMYLDMIKQQATESLNA